MPESAQAGAAMSLRRDAILEAVAIAAERLLLASDWQTVAYEVVARLGEASEVSRAYIVQRIDGPDGAPWTSWVAEWTDLDTVRVSDDPAFTSASWAGSGFGRWADRFAVGETVVGNIDGFPSDERRVLEGHGVRSLASFPIATEAGWWGTIGFDDCRGPRDWSGPDTDALRVTAGLLGAAIQRQRAEEERGDAERAYRAFVEAIPAVTYTDIPTPDGDARMGFISPQIEQILGYAQQRFMDRPEFWYELIHPDDLARLRESDAMNSRDTTPFDEEYRMRAADGRWVWVHDVSTAMFDASGDVAYFQGFLEDITDRRLNQEALREAEERYRHLVERIPGATYLEELEPGTTRAGRTLYFSPQIERISGYPVQDWVDDVGMWERVVHPEDRPLVAEAAHRSNDLGEPIDLDYRIVRPDGTMVWVHEEAALIREDDGSPRAWQGFILDITARKEATELLRVTEEKYRTMVEHMPAITYQEFLVAGGYDPDGPVFASPQIERILGYTQEEWGAPGFWRESIHPDDLEAVDRESQRVVDAGETTYRQEYRMVARDGRVVWIHDESVLIADDAGTPLFWQGVLVDVTDRRTAEDQLRDAEKRFRALVEHIPAIVYQEEIVPQPGGLYLSPQVEQILGYRPEEWSSPEVRGFWTDHIHPDDLGPVLEINAAADRTGDPYVAEYRFRASDGRWVWLHDEAVRVFSQDGTPSFWQGFLFDITERKEAEERLRFTESRLRALIENIPAVVYIEAPDADPARFYISPQVESMFGYSAHEWTWTPDFWVDRVHPDDVDAALVEDRRAHETHTPYQLEYRFLRADGSYTWVHDEAVFLPTEEGDGFWQGFLFDISARMEAEIRLREASERFQAIVEQNPAVIYTQEFDPDDPSTSRTTYISPRQTELFGYSVEEVLADPTLWAKQIHPEDRERVLAADVASNTGEDDVFSMEYRMIGRDGSIVWVHDRAQLQRVDGRPPFWQGFLVDITERKAAESRLELALEVEREATQRLRGLDEMKNTFLQAVSHDLRTPLSAILGLAITLERDDVALSADDSRDLAGRIAANARRLERLVTNLLDLDRLARGIVEPQLAETDLGALVTHVLDESQLLPSERVVADLPELCVRIDASKVERIVENLLANTARHAPVGATVWVSVAPVIDGVMLAVEDDGPGVELALRESIFEPFRQGPDAPAHSPGVGVGLTLVRRFAELHGGRAWVEERDGGGASFRVFLPSASGGADG